MHRLQEGRCTDCRERSGSGASRVRAVGNQHASGARDLRCGRTAGVKHLGERWCSPLPYVVAATSRVQSVECLKTFIFVQHLLWARFFPKAFPKHCLGQILAQHLFLWGGI
jgi:hypothetical protein